MARTFDYSAFRAAFVQSAKAHGIDPVDGATSYQVANLKADLRVQAQLDAPDYGWWQKRDIFSEREADDTTVRHWGDVRIIAVQAARFEEDLDLVPFDGATIVGIMRELRGHEQAWQTAISTPQPVQA